MDTSIIFGRGAKGRNQPTEGRTNLRIIKEYVRKVTLHLTVCSFCPPSLMFAESSFIPHVCVWPGFFAQRWRIAFHSFHRGYVVYFLLSKRNIVAMALSCPKVWSDR